MTKMISDARLDHLRELFAEQFEPEGSDYLYRKGRRGPPIRVTETERDVFVAAYGRRLRLLMWSLLPGVLVLIGAMVVLSPDPNDPSAQPLMWAGLAVLIIPFVLVAHWLWTAPSRELAHRAPLGGARTRREVGDLMLARTSYGELVATALAALMLVGARAMKQDVLHGWGLCWPLGAGAILVILASHAVRKRRRNRS